SPKLHDVPPLLRTSGTRESAGRRFSSGLLMLRPCDSRSDLSQQALLAADEVQSSLPADRIRDDGSPFLAADAVVGWAGRNFELVEKLLEPVGARLEIASEDPGKCRVAVRIEPDHAAHHH